VLPNLFFHVTASYAILRHHLLDQCHHIIQWDQPDAFVRLTLDFLKSLPAEI
jgi:pimeloyl-ACP methyl ester carboxylesterase